jgi:hypothetical protein
MHFHAVENSVQKVENPPAVNTWKIVCNRIFITFHPIIQNSVNLLPFEFSVAFRPIWDIIGALRLKQGGLFL